ncbi:malic enzyme-like NAD(P)-binding protein [Coxiella-like endosymbiont of Rhipicephalus sanguineus]|uniref:malic enzyme-like NAD(P)-binding protein n=1 Tax=Coxiella-like endosymbiont of Rhipicephalus sanguineus TaxID=1955402 RepID=UPI002040DD04|nr:malic enzyme-like NAD(P)-binding protein [Coxiella-like endosymbiont of Rhipicephalus sanguineus]
MAKPIIFHLSNPTEKCEAEPIDLFQWTKGKALIATSSPFEDIIFENKKFLINQCNNYLAFSGIGLGIIAIKAKRVTESWHVEETTHRLLPSIPQAQEASYHVVIAVAKTAIKEGITGVSSDHSAEVLVKQNIWELRYLPYRKNMINVFTPLKQVVQQPPNFI